MYYLLVMYEMIYMIYIHFHLIILWVSRHRLEKILKISTTLAVKNPENELFFQRFASFQGFEIFLNGFEPVLNRTSLDMKIPKRCGFTMIKSTCTPNH